MSFPEPFYSWRPHPWHGISPGPKPPELVQAYVEITPFDLVKYEVDKVSGFLRVDRPQRSSSTPAANPARTGARMSSSSLRERLLARSQSSARGGLFLALARAGSGSHEGDRVGRRAISQSPLCMRQQWLY